jgi:hypothetical protein
MNSISKIFKDYMVHYCIYSERTSRDGQDQQSNKSEKVEMDWARAEITSTQPCKNSPNMDTGGKKKERKTKGDMEENCGEREETSGIQVME